MHIVELTGDDIRKVAEAFAEMAKDLDQVSVLRVAVDDDGFKAQVNHGMWTWGIGRVVEQ